jgi:hypothetical protein
MHGVEQFLEEIDMKANKQIIEERKNHVASEGSVVECNGKEDTTNAIAGY